MHGNDSCCAPARDETQTVQVEAESCGAGYGCGANQSQAEGGCGEGCGCSHGPEFSETETAVMRGFISGLYASTLTREKLASYLGAMAAADGSEFQAPAKFLAGALEATPLSDGKPIGVALLETVTGESVDE